MEKVRTTIESPIKTDPEEIQRMMEHFAVLAANDKEAQPTSQTGQLDSLKKIPVIRPSSVSAVESARDVVNVLPTHLSGRANEQMITERPNSFVSVATKMEGSLMKIKHYVTRVQKFFADVQAGKAERRANREAWQKIKEIERSRNYIGSFKELITLAYIDAERFSREVPKGHELSLEIPFQLDKNFDYVGWFRSIASLSFDEGRVAMVPPYIMYSTALQQAFFQNHHNIVVLPEEFISNTDMSKQQRIKLFHHEAEESEKRIVPKQTSMLFHEVRELVVPTAIEEFFKYFDEWLKTKQEKFNGRMQAILDGMQEHVTKCDIDARASQSALFEHLNTTVSDELAHRCLVSVKKSYIVSQQSESDEVKKIKLLMLLKTLPLLAEFIFRKIDGYEQHERRICINDQDLLERARVIKEAQIDCILNIGHTVRETQTESFIYRSKLGLYFPVVQKRTLYYTPWGYYVLVRKEFKPDVDRANTLNHVSNMTKEYLSAVYEQYSMGELKTTVDIYADHQFFTDEELLAISSYERNKNE